MSEIRTEAEAVADIAVDTVNRTNEVEPDSASIFVTVAKSTEVVKVDSFERFRSTPRRPRGTEIVHTPQSFIDLVTALAGEEDPVVYAHKAAPQIVAIVNHFGGWLDHRVTYSPKFDRRFSAWFSRNGKMVTQVDFAEFLEDHASAISIPDPADLIEIARNFQATSKVSFESGNRLQSGDVQFSYIEETGPKAGAKGTIKIPETFVISLPVYEGTSALAITAKLRYRITKDGLALGYKLVAIEDYIEASFLELADAIVTGLPQSLHLEGEAPSPVAPLS
ncbi:DUF2303 family protein [Williamsia sp.]|uniref:DUF2303 family protein n=1 Tax=Williamsia sp. TaxID=1872085 RepID=UPI002F935002